MARSAVSRRTPDKVRVLVLGGTGFIGSAVTEELLKRGIPVTSYGSRKLDLSSPRACARLRRLIDGRTVVFLLSRAPYGGASWAGYAGDVSILATAASALQARRARKWVYLSSTAIYGAARSNLSIREDAPPAPESPYAASKVLGERLLEAASARGGSPLLILRPPMVYGPGDRSSAYGPGRLVASLIAQGELRLFGDGGELRDYLFIGDLARIAVDLALGPWTGAFNVSGGAACSFASLAKRLQRLAGKGRIVRDARRVAKTDQRLDPRKLRRALPHAQFTSIARGLEAAYLAALDAWSVSSSFPAFGPANASSSARDESRR